MHLLGEWLIRFEATLVQFYPSSGQKTLKMGQNAGFWPLSEKVFTQSNSNLWCTISGWVFRTDSLLGPWPNFGPLVATKWLKIEVSGHYPKKHSHNPIQSCVQLLRECSELIRFWATLTKFWPCSGHKMTENGDFRSLPEKLFTQSKFLPYFTNYNMYYQHLWQSVRYSPRHHLCIICAIPPQKIWVEVFLLLWIFIISEITYKKTVKINNKFTFNLNICRVYWC